MLSPWVSSDGLIGLAGVPSSRRLSGKEYGGMKYVSFKTVSFVPRLWRVVGLSVALYAVRMSVYAVPCVPSVLMGLYAVHGACEGNAGACAVPLPLRPLLCRQ